VLLVADVVEGRKRFFLKKEAKTFAHSGTHRATSTPQ
jgi:hypothetical protein